ncbi:hypothetical protein [Aeromonas sp. CA23]|uniref:hypothetical protein n=1 Tax=Aeromonas sp. CA23 TaxID=2033032 RepID=UPI0012FE6C5F|nr:hypothetical protein [Aeromonas sp. CA23]
MKNFLIYKCLSKALKKPAPDLIPRTGEDAASVDCYSCRIILNDNISFWVESIERDCINGYTIGEKSDDRLYKKLTLNDVGLSQVKIKKYKGIYDYTFENGYDFILKDLTKYIDIVLFSIKEFDVITQSIFNKKSLQKNKRTDILKILVERYSTRNTEFNIVSLMMHIHSSKYFNHPDKDTATSLLKLYLNSFVESGEVIKTQGINYKLTGKAIVTLENYENEERKHKENLRLQRIITFTTIIMALLAAIQADLVKMPTILDLTSFPYICKP